MKSLIHNHALQVCFFIIPLFVTTSSLASQNKKQSNNFFWLNIGLGGSSNGGTLSANFSYQFMNNIFTLRATGSGELFGDWNSDIGLLYGRTVTSSSKFLYSGGIGISYVEIIKEKDGGFFNPPDKIIHTIGLPIEVQLFWRAAGFLGFGLYGFLNINSEEPFLGATICLQLGKLR